MEERKRKKEKENTICCHKGILEGEMGGRGLEGEDLPES